MLRGPVERDLLVGDDDVVPVGGLGHSEQQPPGIPELLQGVLTVGRGPVVGRSRGETDRKEPAAVDDQRVVSLTVTKEPFCARRMSGAAHAKSRLGQSLIRGSADVSLGRQVLHGCYSCDNYGGRLSFARCWSRLSATTAACGSWISLDGHKHNGDFLGDNRFYLGEHGPQNFYRVQWIGGLSVAVFRHYPAILDTFTMCG